MDAITWDEAGASMERGAREGTLGPAGEGGVEGLWEAHYAAVLGYALRRLPAEGAREIAADAFVVAWRRRNQTRAADRAWLIGIVRNLVANRRRALGRHERLVARAEWDAERALETEDPAQGEVLEALSRLSEADQEALMLVGWDGLDAREASIVLGCSAATFAVRLHRARRRLRRELAVEESS
jgi:RNA polymerase sigma-70 factor (ECF subfamily)